MTDMPKTNRLRSSSRGVVPLIAAVAIILIMVGSVIIVLLGGSVHVQFSLP